MTALEKVLFWVGWALALPTIGFVVMWIVAMVWCATDRRRADDEENDDLAPPSITEADAWLRDSVSPDCSPLNRRAAR
jgi:hypothetical protein